MLKVSTLITEIKKARTPHPLIKTIYTNEEVQGKNQFLFFVKPGITLDDESIQLTDILTFILKKLTEAKMNILSASILNAPYLDSNNIIAQHYGIINQLASEPKLHFSQEAIKAFEKNYGQPFDEAPIKGGLEMLSESKMELSMLNDLWFSGDMVKLGSGTYVVKTSYNEREVFLVNGFHAQQIQNFIAPNRSIICFNMVSDIDWAVARNEVLGSTNPSGANPGSIRRLLYDEQKNHGALINYSQNGAHLSAGPVEALIELMRYSHRTDRKVKITDFQFGKELTNAFTINEVQCFLQNPEVVYKGNKLSVFDLTEEKNADESIEMLKKVAEAVKLSKV